MRRIVSIFLVIVLMFSLCANVLASDGSAAYSDAEGGGNLLTIVIICMVISIIVCLILKAQLRSVRTENASAYATPQGLDLHVKTDRFTHVTRHVTRVASSRAKK